MLIFLDTLIHHLYFVLTGLLALLLIRGFVQRENRNGLVYDLVYAYTIIPFILRFLHIK